MTEEQQILGSHTPEYQVDIKGIFAKVKWTDIPIVTTIILYLILLIIALKVRRNPRRRTIVFVLCLGITLGIGQLGPIMEKNWKIFGFSDNYFDEFGVFLTFFFALPPVFIAILLLSQLVGNITDKVIHRYVNNRTEHNEPAEEKNASKSEEATKEKNDTSNPDKLKND
ncbi:hypothetical protein TVAG_071270 [Trichomonas vaginalis G3]|uniref:Uncharacterized protein n=1 Tax=Trichomonas vaginalis (strain ATCC PRA-98 / G3) TaxID=412133 RepID=A2D830_TRIV3|nr:transmembrane protein 18 family [Trichomonas vaginalis G3]EAY23463.1 hypothetical protein TVAG_071270 [Trichomonas vaginalis G3]KAI5493880.1 transmembrane protein 18 family [Trichomonas vaginalis G3]|eukprot:XP_001584449.1 hypothetical protein [Trichomonas vaginalis G3]